MMVYMTGDEGAAWIHLGADSLELHFRKEPSFQNIPSLGVLVMLVET